LKGKRKSETHVVLLGKKKSFARAAMEKERGRTRFDPLKKKRKKHSKFVFRNCFYVRYNHIEWVCLLYLIHQVEVSVSSIFSSPLSHSLYGNKKGKKSAVILGSLSDDKLHTFPHTKLNSSSLHHSFFSSPFSYLLTMTKTHSDGEL
jgi:hypothetical protein